ncbi:hypothetical protein MSHRCOH1_04320 [Candidatus Ornithobacterium hominis]|nr:hypothetical protein [Candidatus Ornithobacterium hominis]CAI9429417.1 hypothetical protein MSHRCOH1_04320 [Candidatus Ornithobacterium hominis]
MAKTIKIVELDIDVQALTEKAAQSRGEVQQLQQNIKALKDAQKDAQKEF